MNRHLILLLLIVITSCQNESATYELIHGPWNIERIEQNGTDLINESAEEVQNNFYVAPKFYVNLDNNDFFIEVDPYRKEFIRGSIFLQQNNGKSTIVIKNSDRAELDGEYKFEIDTLEIGSNGDTFRIHMLSNHNTYLIALKTRVKSLLGKD